MEKNINEPECYGCKYLASAFGNYVECKKSAEVGIHMFVDWYYWNKGSPDTCPFKNDKKDSYNCGDGIGRRSECREK